ncbi:hypothetical protein WKK05_26250 [Nostoc sp. UHCC 0302]|uniref:hypothetical protein n=1 Tax=Nostoc sp. UHCC 0302 TaxID=3134896 RepID=UPI00311CD975
MLNNIRQVLSPRQLGIPFVGILLTFGFMGNQTKPVLSNQVERTSTLLVTDSQVSSARIQNSTETPLLSKLREVREQRSQLAASNSEQNQVANSAIFNNQQQSNLVSSASLLKNEKTLPKTLALVPGSQASVTEAVVMPRGNFPAKDGIYLYGQSPKPNQIGQGYIIFQKQQGKVSGAMYMPHSEFSCFQGTLDQSGELAMTVNGSPDEGGSNQVATANRLPTVADDESSSYAYSVALQDYHQLNSISASDRRILQMCNPSATASYSKFVK